MAGLQVETTQTKVGADIIGIEELYSERIETQEHKLPSGAIWTLKRMTSQEAKLIAEKLQHTEDQIDFIAFAMTLIFRGARVMKVQEPDKIEVLSSFVSRDQSWTERDYEELLRHHTEAPDLTELGSIMLVLMGVDKEKQERTTQMAVQERFKQAPKK